MGTRGGALALGHEEAGLVAPGHDADLCLFDPPPWAEDADAVLASLIFDHDAPPMRRTWVRGRALWDRDAAPRGTFG
jgi:cytosine/adenosine deaminase-related metal-dependent hydrolase